MKILMVLEGAFPPDDRVEKEALSLIKAKHEVHLICPSFKDRPKSENYKNINIHRIRFNKEVFKKLRGAALTLPFYFVFAKKHIFSLVREIKPDAIHIHDLPLANIGLEVQKEFGCTPVLDLHENYPDMLATAPYSKTLQGRIFMPIPLWRKYERRMLKKYDNIIVTVEEMGERLRKIKPSLDYHTVENTLDLNMFPQRKQQPKNQKTIKLVYIGGIEEHRGIQYAIKGFIETLKTHENLEFHLHGKGRYVDTLKKIIKQYSLEDKVFLQPLLKFPQEAVKLSEYDIGLIPGIKSTQNDCSSPNKLYQYMYYGLAVMASNLDSIERIIKETACGITYTFDDSSEFATKLSNMISTNLNQYKENAHKAVVKKYNWVSNDQILAELYESIKPPRNKDLSICYYGETHNHQQRKNDERIRGGE